MHWDGVQSKEKWRTDAVETERCWGSNKVMLGDDKKRRDRQKETRRGGELKLKLYIDRHRSRSSQGARHVCQTPKWSGLRCD